VKAASNSGVGANVIDAVDISKSRFKANPYPFYAKLRADHPVFPVNLPDGQTAWLITRHDDALSALKDRRFSKDKLNAGQKQPWTPAFSSHSVATCLMLTIRTTHGFSTIFGVNTLCTRAWAGRALLPYESGAGSLASNDRAIKVRLQ
jgi:hypothetical protein